MPTPDLPGSWYYQQPRHIWVRFHNYVHPERLIAVDILKIQAAYDNDGSTIIYLDNRAVEVQESVEDVLAAIRESTKWTA